MKLFFWYVSLQLSDALVVTDKSGVVYYVSLGKWSTLVDIVKKDFTRVKRPHALIPGRDETRSEQIKDVLAKVKELLDHPDHFSTLSPSIEVSFLFGTSLHQQIWTHLREHVRAGKTSTYNEIAKALGRPGQARVVGGACAANRVALLVPCHRVLNTKNELTGYRWGTGLKKELLAREGAKV